MSFDAHGSVQGSPAAQPVMEGGVIPSSKPAETAVAAPEASPTPPTPSTPAVDPRFKPAAPATPEVPPADPANFVPNFKFKVMDKEHEIAEAFRGIIKDSDTEKLVKELHEKAYGLDVVKPRLHETREKLKSVESSVKNYETGIGELREHYQRGDFDSFFQKLNIPEEKVLQWVVDKAKYNELPPDQRNVLDAKRSAEQRAQFLEKEQTQLQGKYEEALVQSKARDLQFALEKDEVRQFAEAFDSRAAKPGSFFEEVIRTGEYAWYSSKGKIDLTPEQAIQEVLSRYQGLVQPRATQPPMIPVNGQHQQAYPQAAPTPPAQKTPTLPNIGGRQSSSVSKAKPRSIADLKKLAEEMGQRG